MFKRIYKFQDVFLLPLAGLWGLVHEVRRFLFEYNLITSYRFEVPIISVGNITFGGSGKTPLVTWLIEWANQEGVIPMVVTRGYKSKLEESSGILLADQKFKINPLSFGDEPLLIAQKMSRGAVVVGKKRSQNLMKYFPQIRPDIVFLDDGHQHLKMKRNCNIVLFDLSMKEEDYRLAPLGRMREHFSALRSADIIIFNKTQGISDHYKQMFLEHLRGFTSRKTLFAETRYSADRLTDAHGQESFSVDDLRGKDVLIISGLASPESFHLFVKSLGANVIETITFSDHHEFSAEEINEVLVKASQKSALVICTEKDMIKVKRITQDNRIFSLGISVKFVSGEDQVKSRLKSLAHLADSAQ